MIVWSSSNNYKETSISVRGIHGPCFGQYFFKVCQNYYKLN